MLAVGDRAKELRKPATLGNGSARDFALTDQLRSEPGGTATLAGRAPQNQGIAAIFDDGMCITLSVSVRDLGNRLKTENASAAKFTQTRERVLQAVYFSQGIQLVDHEPQAIVRAGRVFVAL